MKKTNQKTLEEIIRVDHAGERGAIKIYEGQLLALKTVKQDNDLKDKIEEMKEQQKEHLEYFQKEIICDDKTSGNPVRNFAPKVTPSRKRNYEFDRSAQTDKCSVK